VKALSSLIALTFCSLCALASPQNIVCGWLPGEIFFEGCISTGWGWPGLYYSSDYGEHIELRDSIDFVISDNYGVLLTDANENTINRLFLNITGTEHMLTYDGGFTWELINDEVTRGQTYATGVITGEIYRESIEPILNLERSDNYGANYTICSTIGFPDTLWIYSVSLGVDSGEVYIWSQEGDLFYSSDFGEYFIYLGNLTQSGSVTPQSELINGAEPGELYIFHQDSKQVWRSYDFGAEVDLIEHFPHPFWWYAGIATSNLPGELYYLAMEAGFVSGGLIEIWHTLNYGENWTIYTHTIESIPVVNKTKCLIPTITNFKAYPNPANASFTIDYTLPRIESIELGIFNLLGQQMWHYKPGTQLPGNYQIFIEGESFPSGMYLLTLQTNERRWYKKITLLK